MFRDTFAFMVNKDYKYKKKHTNVQQNAVKTLQKKRKRTEKHRENKRDSRKLSQPRNFTEPALTAQMHEPDPNKQFKGDLIAFPSRISRICWLNKLRKVKVKHLPSQPLQKKPPRPGRKKKLSLIKGQSLISNFLQPKSPPEPPPLILES